MNRHCLAIVSCLKWKDPVLEIHSFFYGSGDLHLQTVNFSPSNRPCTRRGEAGPSWARVCERACVVGSRDSNSLTVQIWKFDSTRFSYFRRKIILLEKSWTFKIVHIFYDDKALN